MMMMTVKSNNISTIYNIITHFNRLDTPINTGVDCYAKVPYVLLFNI